MELAEVFADAAADIAADIASRTELKARVKIRQPKELKVFNSLRLFIAVTAEIFTKLISRIEGLPPACTSLQLAPLFFKQRITLIN